MEMENENRKQVRNMDGKLVCEVTYEADVWVVSIKDHDCMTDLYLPPDGRAVVRNRSVRKVDLMDILSRKHNTGGSGHK